MRWKDSKEGDNKNRGRKLMGYCMSKLAVGAIHVWANGRSPLLLDSRLRGNDGWGRGNDEIARTGEILK
jgi:hypothetical protein